MPPPPPLSLPKSAPAPVKAAGAGYSGSGAPAPTAPSTLPSRPAPAAPKKVPGAPSALPKAEAKGRAAPPPPRALPGVGARAGPSDSGFSAPPPPAGLPTAPGGGVPSRPAPAAPSTVPKAPVRPAPPAALPSASGSPAGLKGPEASEPPTEVPEEEHHDESWREFLEDETDESAPADSGDDSDEGGAAVHGDRHKNDMELLMKMQAKSTPKERKTSPTSPAKGEDAEDPPQERPEAVAEGSPRVPENPPTVQEPVAVDGGASDGATEVAAASETPAPPLPFAGPGPSQPLEGQVEAPIENLFGDFNQEGLQSYLEGLASDVSQELYDPGSEDAEGEDDFQAEIGRFTDAERRQHERAIFEQCLPQIGMGLPRLPWEQGIYAQIFGGEDTFGLPTPDTWMPAPAMLPFTAEPEEVGSGMSIDPQMRQAAVGMPVFAKYVKALSDRDYAATQDLAWTKALACWLALLEGSQFDSLVGRYVRDKVNDGDRVGALACIRDACGIRSPNTVLKRGKDLQLYVNWADKHSVQWWPLEEVKLLTYMDYVEGASKSKFIGKNLVHALKFFKYLFGAEFDVDLVCGPLLKGRVSRVLASREPTEQARALSVEEVKLLEDKWGDMSSMQSLELDVIQVGDGPFGFIEAKTRIHKTSSSEERKAMFMPYAAPIRGIGDVPWGLEWEKALTALHLLPGGTPYGPICRAPTADGNFTKRALTTAEASDMLNAFLGTERTERSTTSHSLKATTLVWAARYGMDDKCRAMLGHHALKEHSLACYSRDMLAKPLRDLSAMLLNIKSGKFDPDGTRSGWMASQQLEMRLDKAKEFRDAAVDEASSIAPSPSLGPERDPAEEPGFDPSNPFQEREWDEPAKEGTDESIPGEAELAGEEIVASASSEEEAEVETDSEADVEAFFERQRSLLDNSELKAVEGDLMQNRRSKMLHVRSDDLGNHLQPVTKCGLHGQGFQCLPNGAAFEWPKCSRCFKDDHEKDKDLVDVINAGKRRRL
eukprot:s447_g28.t1